VFVLCMTAHYVYCLRCYTHEFLKDFFLSAASSMFKFLRSMIMYVSLCVCMYMCACVCVSKKFL
jgi:hypothetical protein